MSSWVSHYPDDLESERVAGLGMNAEELAENPQLTEWVVHDLNADPVLPYGDGEFDVVTIAVSVQYLTRPLEVFREIGRVLRPGGGCIVSFSNRCFPTKAVWLGRGWATTGMCRWSARTSITQARSRRRSGTTSPRPRVGATRCTWCSRERRRSEGWGPLEGIRGDSGGFAAVGWEFALNVSGKVQICPILSRFVHKIPDLLSANPAGSG